MDFWPAYLLNRFFYRIADFFHHWYVHGSLQIGQKYKSLLSDLDQSFAFRVTLKHFSEPLYKDYSIIGRILGVIFRTGRLIAGGVVYLIVSIIFAVIYLAWLAVPPVILFYIIHG